MIPGSLDVNGQKPLICQWKGEVHILHLSRCPQTPYTPQNSWWILIEQPEAGEYARTACARSNTARFMIETCQIRWRAKYTCEYVNVPEKKWCDKLLVADDGELHKRYM